MTKAYKSLLEDFSEADVIREYKLLSDDYIRKVSLIKRTEDKRRTMGGLILLRRAVKQNFGISSYDITLNENGKPLLDFCYFNISHSEQYVVLAISDKPVGIDIQKMRSITRRDDYRLFTYNEVSYVNSESGDFESKFFEIWTKKEAYIKMLGLRLSDAAKYDVLKVTDARFTTEENDGYMLTMCEKI